MPFSPPSIDDRSFQDLVDDLLTRIPAHTPEWTNPREGDPGRTLIELFAWLGDTLLYRANLIPERQRLAFLRLLGAQMRPAMPARGVVSIRIDDDKAAQAVTIRPLAVIRKPIPFETLSELTILPVTAEAYYKRRLSEDEIEGMEDLITGLKQIYRIQNATPYVTTPVFPDGTAEPDGFDLVTRTVDACVWLALLAPSKDLVSTAKTALGTNPAGGQQLLSVGVMPALSMPDPFEEVGAHARIPHVWEISGVDRLGRFTYFTLDPVTDTTVGLTQRGVVRLALPAAEFIAAPSNDVRQNLTAGLGDTPPRLDATDKTDRLVAWVRLRPTMSLHTLSLSWVDINAVEIDQRQTIIGRVVGQSNGASDQILSLSAVSVDPDTLQIHVEEPERGYQLWQRVNDLALAGRDSAVYSLDSEAGTVRFGNGVRGRIPSLGARIRVAFMRARGGLAGNLPPGALDDILASNLLGEQVQRLKVQQALATDQGEDTETLDRAEQRVPALLRHQSRAVTTEDYQRLAAETPGVRLGRVEVLPRFKPQQRRTGEQVPGVVSVMVWPFKDGLQPPNPRPDRPTREAVHAYLEARRPLTTEMYVIGCEYKVLGISIGITILGETGDSAPGEPIVGRDTVLMHVREAVRRYLWPLPPGGVAGAGWALGRTVRDREIEVVVARVAGVDMVARVNLFVPNAAGDDWEILARATPDAPVDLPLLPWQLPELLSIVVTADGEAPEDLRGVSNPFVSPESIAIPVVPKLC